MLTKHTKKILSSIGVITVASAFVLGSTGAFFSDTEASSGNVFTAGAIDLTVDHANAWYNGEVCEGSCSETGDQLVANGGFESPSIAAGTWQIYGNGSQTNWTVESGDGLEIQNHAAGAPHSGSQHAELDSSNSSSISQVIDTESGKRYRLSFWYSPRPDNDAGDNAIAYEVQVVSGGTTIVNGSVEANPGNGTQWVQYTFDFIAAGTDSKIIFSDDDASDGYGGYLDDISVRELECDDASFGQGGQCHLWGEKDLEPGDYFWNFNDIKPSDHGRNVMSLHVNDNDAWTCLAIQNGDDQENGINDAESDAGDVSDPEGELSGNLDLFVWTDSDADGQYEPGSGENGLYEDSFSPLVDIPLHDSTTSNGAHAGGTTEYIGMAWCAGTQSVDHSTGAITCDGASVSNQAQTDSFTADLVAYAEQWRNNPDFTCEGTAQNDKTVLTLENKTDNWDVIDDDRYATLSFISSHPTFDYALDVFGLEPNTQYSLIYYPDPWPGTGAIEITSFMTDGSGNYDETGDEELNTDLPITTDTNAEAKIWIIPTSDWGGNQLSAWNPSEYLFETMLVSYDDTEE